MNIRFQRAQEVAVAVLLVAAVVGGSAQKSTTKKKAAGTQTTASKHTNTRHGKTISTHKPSAARLKAHAYVSAKGKTAVRRVVEPTPESRRLSIAFTASAQLRPMAQQLASTRSVAAYNGVRNFAASHPGEAAATAQLAIGHANMLDRHFAEAESAFRAAGQGSALSDYADYLAAQAAVQGGRPGDAIPLLEHFSGKYPGTLFVPNALILLANAYLSTNNAANALHLLQPLENTSAGSHTDFRAALAHAYQLAGSPSQAAALYRGIYLNDPLSSEAANAKTQLAALNYPLTPAERKQHADAMFNAKQYEAAASEYRALQKNDSALTQADRDALEIYAAVCDLRLKKLSRKDVERLPVTGDDSAALKLYLQSELARNEGNTDEHDHLVVTLISDHPHSRWLEEALYSGGNMYLVRGDIPRAVDAYVELTHRFPRSTYAPSAHWHAAWLSYRTRQYPEAAKLMEEQITNYSAGTEVPGALYWRARMYEEVEHNFPQAANYYRALNAAYVNSYYGMLGRQRLEVIGRQATVEPAPTLASVRVIDDLHLTAQLPENDPHLIKARLLANAALNEYIRPELQLSDVSGEWSALAEAEIYQSFGETTRAIQAMKRSKIPFFSLPVASVPMEYWQVLFPRPYWTQLTNDAQANGLDPYLVASLIRQESEFNPGAVSHANAYGLMQLLPSVGKSLAKKEGNRHFTTGELLDPTTNLQLGTVDLKASINRYGGQVEYALASYNAGDTPVHKWIAVGDYKDIPEWVESIPYTETREYVQAILRNRELYRAIYSGR